MLFDIYNPEFSSRENSSSFDFDKFGTEISHVTNHNGIHIPKIGIVSRNSFKDKTSRHGIVKGTIKSKGKKAGQKKSTRRTKRMLTEEEIKNRAVLERGKSKEKEFKRSTKFLVNKFGTF